MVVGENESTATNFLPPASHYGKIKNLTPTKGTTSESQFWVLFVVNTNKNHEQPFSQYVGSDEPNSMGASYHPEEVPFEFG